jgi:lipopolysaccharide/colanic/teichoic acid biosynthesis glycosyltransferase
MIGRGVTTGRPRRNVLGLLMGRDVPGGAHGVHSRETFQAIIRRERARVDRNSHCFSLAVFEIPHRNVDRKLYEQRLADTLVERSRFTDETGWLDESDLGVLLTETGEEGTRIFADSVKLNMARWGPAPECTIYTYPSDGSDGGHGDGHDQLSFEDLEVAPRHDLGEPAPAVKKEPAACSPAAKEGEQEPQDVFDDFAKRYLAVRMPVWKRALDVAGSLAGLILLSPLMLATAALIKPVSPGPVFFRQERVGYLGEIFSCLKFRTMHVDNDASGHQQYLSNLINSEDAMTKLDGGKDRRIIPLGRLLRVTAIDELPQLINVLRGEMSLVGPRPCIPYEYEEYHLWHRNRVDAVPGLTGLWQVNGKNRTTFKQMMRLDIRYAREMSLWMDITILVHTIPAVLTQVRDSRRQKRAMAAAGAWATQDSTPALT